MVYELEVAKSVPPLAALYQYICSGEEALNVTVPAPQRETPEPVGAAGNGSMIASTAVRLRL